MKTIKNEDTQKLVEVTLAGAYLLARSALLDDKFVCADSDRVNNYNSTFQVQPPPLP